ncbi:MAG: LysE family translocator, partial [Hyphomicrobiales bacterium]
MDTVLFMGFLTTTLLFVAVPGPSVAFATAQAIKHGKRGAFVTVAGDALGTIVHITIAGSSLTALMSLSAMVLPFLQIIGGIFILYMGYQALKSVGKITDATSVISDKATFWAGFFACVANPKAIVFFVALFPAFISPQHSVLLQTLVYGTIFIVLDAISILAFALLT